MCRTKQESLSMAPLFLAARLKALLSSLEYLLGTLAMPMAYSGLGSWAFFLVAGFFTGSSEAIGFGAGITKYCLSALSESFNAAFFASSILLKNPEITPSPATANRPSEVAP